MPLPLLGAQAGYYRPRSARNVLKDLLEENLEDLFRLWEDRFEKDHRPLHPRLRKLFEAFLRCGDLHRKRKRGCRRRRRSVTLP